jgi:hypothetical protein
MKRTNQKTRCVPAIILTMACGGLALVSGCVIQPNGHAELYVPTIALAPAVEVAPPTVVVAPPGVVVEPVMVPEAYAWDGVEYVGVVGDQYLYLGPGDVWLVAGPDRLARFHGWERGHADWRGHATRNDRFRKDARGHVQPRRDDKKR